jgi:hypothetical protein
MVNVYMGVLIVSMVYTVLRNVPLTAMVHFVTKTLANVQQVAEQE